MNDIYFISDTHFSHGNLIDNFVCEDGSPARPNPKTGKRFASVSEHDEMLIQNWNNNIRPQDKVYHLGDVVFGSKSSYNSILCRLNGHKRLILGNHDQLVDTTLGQWFEKIEVWRLFKEYGFICTHVPIHRDCYRAKSVLNVHGHVHQNSMKEEWYHNICVEKTQMQPVSLETLIAVAKQIKS